MDFDVMVKKIGCIAVKEAESQMPCPEMLRLLPRSSLPTPDHAYRAVSVRAVRGAQNEAPEREKIISIAFIERMMDLSRLGVPGCPTLG